MFVLYYTPRMPYKVSKFGSDRSVIRVIYLGCILPFRLYLGSHRRDFLENSYLVDL